MNNIARDIDGRLPTLASIEELPPYTLFEDHDEHSVVEIPALVPTELLGVVNAGIFIARQLLLPKDSVSFTLEVVPAAADMDALTLRLPKQSRLEITDIAGSMIKRLDAAVVSGAVQLTQLDVCKLRVAIADGTIDSLDVSVKEIAEFIAIAGQVSASQCSHGSATFEDTSADALSVRTETAPIRGNWTISQSLIILADSAIIRGKLDISGNNIRVSAKTSNWPLQLSISNDYAGSFGIRAVNSVISFGFGSATIYEQTPNWLHGVPALPVDLANDLPPAYSVADPNVQVGTAALPAPDFNVQGDIKIDQKQPNALVATKAFGLDRLLYFHTSNISTCSLIVEHNPDSSSQSSVVVTAEVSSQMSDLKERSTITMEENAQGEYEVLVSLKWSVWNVFSTQCKFIVRVPSSAVIEHPGIRAQVCNDHYGMGHLQNITFNVLDVQAPNSDVSLSAVNGGRISICSTNGEIEAKRVQAFELLSLVTTNKILRLTDSHSPDIHVQTSNRSITLDNVSGDRTDAETSNSRIKCSNVIAGSLRLKTRNAGIDTSMISADDLRLITSNSSVKGTWLIKNKLEITTSNSKIAGAVQLKDTRERASIDLTTSNSSIDVSLPANGFRGSFDAKTSNSSVGVEWAGESFSKEPPIRYIVDTKSYKRGSVGASAEYMHDMSAKTSNSSISIKFIDEF
ncbi:hypothetical protein IWW50_003361 [Coemansia erecta]|nr:hypothetical protein IWW50_003361 [Coemansia erecta]